MIDHECKWKCGGWQDGYNRGKQDHYQLALKLSRAQMALTHARKELAAAVGGAAYQLILYENLKLEKGDK